jgi:hypothetical protein
VTELKSATLIPIIGVELKGWDAGASDDLFFLSVPAHGSALPIAVDGHAARDGDPEAEIERAGRFFAGANAVEKILHVGVGRRGGPSQQLDAVGTVHLLGNVADGLTL